jgi:hypothetical protein
MTKRFRYPRRKVIGGDSIEKVVKNTFDKLGLTFRWCKPDEEVIKDNYTITTESMSKEEIENLVGEGMDSLLIGMHKYNSSDLEKYDVFIIEDEVTK